MKSGKDLRPAQQVEEASNGRLLPIKEAPALGRNKEIKEETGQMEVSYHTKNSSYWKNVFFFLALMISPKVTQQCGFVISFFIFPISAFLLLWMIGSDVGDDSHNDW